MPPKRFEKGSQEAKDYMRMLREKRGGAKISRPAVEKGKPEPAKIEGGSGAGAGKRKRASPPQRQRSPPVCPPAPQRQRQSQPPPIRTLPVRNLSPPLPPMYQQNPNISQDENDDEEVEYYMSGGKIPPPPSRVYGGKVPPPPSRYYDTAFEDKIDGVMISGGSLKDCPTCCGCGIVKLMKKGYTG